MESYQLNAKEITIDNNILTQIYSYYYFKENMIYVCKGILDNFTFDGGVSLIWGKVAKTALTDRDQFELKKLFTVALDYKRMFGFVPIKFVEDKNSGTKQPEIPEFGTVNFVMYLDERTSQYKMYFIEKGKNYISRKKAIKNNMVFVWAGFGPGLNGEIKSPMMRLLGKYYRFDEFLTNSLDSDYISAHPTVFVRNNMEVIKNWELTENEIWADDVDESIDPMFARTYKRDSYKFNMSNRRQDDLRNSQSANYSRQISEDGKRVESRKRKRVWDGNIYPLLPVCRFISFVLIFSSKSMKILHLNSYQHQTRILSK